MSFGAHDDNPVRQVAGTPFRVRTDRSATLFLARPEEYDGGELILGCSARLAFGPRWPYYPGSVVLARRAL